METKGLRALRISLASPETIRSWSYGEVLKPETINYRRLRPEKDGLFDEAIFGPTRDWQCYCGKYKNIRYKGIVCDKCGVEVTRSSVRRERMGHIALAAPVAHVWYTRRVPSYLGLLLDISRRNLDRVLYFAQYVVTYVDEDAREKALARLAEEINDAEKEHAGSINSQIAEVKKQRDEKLAELDKRTKEIETRYDEELAAKIDPIIKEGQKLETKLQEQQGKESRAGIKFSNDAVIVQPGETVASQHIAAVQAQVKAFLEAQEKDAAENKQKELERLAVERASIKAESEMGMNQLRMTLDDKTAPEQDERVRAREELETLRHLTFMGENRYRELRTRYGQVFRADMGAEAFYDILERLDLDKLAEELWTELRTSRSKQRRRKATNRLRVVESFRRSGNRPEWMIMTVLPVIPPDLRPMVQLDGGRFATSDLNDLYRRVINRNNRLKRLLELGAPDVIVRNEKRMLQEAVDSLIDNSQRGKALSRRGRRELKSLSDLLKGKKGRFRRNLLGKRVDYSGRSVIVVGPQLKLYQCGLPKSMALELYKPFVISELVAKGYTLNVKGAKRIIDRNRPEVYEVLEEVIKQRPVLLNRAPTLHRLGIQAFEPILIEGSAIQLHPLVTTAFNADFDGDQMAVHVPLSRKAVWEARELMLSTRNLLKPADGEPIIGPSKDMVLGVYYLTMEPHALGKDEKPRVFSEMDEVDMAYQLQQVKVHTPIRLRAETWFDDQGNRLAEPETRMLDTTVGRVLFNMVLEPEIRFVNEKMGKGEIKDLIAQLLEVTGDEERTTGVADRVKDIGFKYATRSGTTIAISDITIPEEKGEIVAAAMEREEAVEEDFRRGLLTEQEQNERVIEIWQETTNKVAKAVRERMNPLGNLATMANSGATKGGFSSISQLAGMRGMMADPSGRIIPLPIRSNFREGLTTLEYFISTHGSRKGLADTALRTADAGYLTRRLVDVAQDVITIDDDCGTEEGIWIRSTDKVADQALSNRVSGRVAAQNIVDPKTGEVLVEKNQLIGHEETRRVAASAVEEVYVFSPLTCEAEQGICIKCYGMDLGRGRVVDTGAAVGIVAAQSIGEPGTQLTLRTFHTGGVAAESDITTGLPRVEELFEARRAPKGEAVVAELGGTVEVSQSERFSDMRIIRILHSAMVHDEYELPKGYRIAVEDGQKLEAGAVLASLKENDVKAENAGIVRIEDRVVYVSYEQKEVVEYEVPNTTRMLIKSGEKVEAGQALTEGSLNPHNILRIQGRDACYMYLLSEVQRVYRSQGQNIHDKHFEVIIRKMMSKVQVTRPGDTGYLPGDHVNRLDMRKKNEALIAEGREPGKFVEVLLGITKASLTTDSFLSAASFQHTIKVLAGAAIAGQEDYLTGLKENVILGKLIPAGTGHPANAHLLPPPEPRPEARVEAPLMATELDMLPNVPPIEPIDDGE
ncbi:MAG: DNA-directed RNA polymerase subunit beta' [Anaerolineales bacterium]|nr:DNA-directed RNA polymerase subunit beta' [Anaerolineales bacterium]MCW5855863.1 DNA-directed RNA polymerase subunit beta' [Anaerolineales bacterium]